MTNKTITLSREKAIALAYADASNGASAIQLMDGWRVMAELRAALADPVPPAGGEPEVFEPHGWAQTDGPRINAFTREFDIAEEWAMAGYGTVELLNREHVDDEIDRLRGEHQAHVTRLQAEVERLKDDVLSLGCIVDECGKERVVLQSELTKARELLKEADNFMYIMTGHDSHARLVHQYGKEWWTPVNELRGKICTALSNQSAPADKERFANGTFVGSATLVGSAGNPIWGWKFVESGTPGTPGRWEECPIKFAPADKGQGETVAKHEKHCTLLDPEEPSAECTCNHRFMSLADDPRRCADCDAIEVISEQPAPVAVVMPSRDNLRDIIAQAIGGDTYDCTRVWSAWGVGTMSEDDFVPVVDQESRLYEMADACLDEFARLNPIKQ